MSFLSPTTSSAGLEVSTDAGLKSSVREKEKESIIYVLCNAVMMLVTPKSYSDALGSAF